MTSMIFKTVVRHESQQWSTDGEKITAPENLERIRKVLETTGPILVEHWFFYGSRSPDRIVIGDYDEFIEYLKEKAHAGDAIHVWDLDPLLREDNELAHGKCPAEDGAVPSKGAY
jgi:hypothetical protein